MRVAALRQGYMATPDLKAKLVAAVRSWVHMDNLIENLNQQANNARTLRTKHEEEIIRLMKQLGLSGSKIQVGGGAELQLARRKTQSDLSWGYLEREIPAWAARSGIPPAQSSALLKWLQEHREIREKEYIKKTGGQQQPPPS